MKKMFIKAKNTLKNERGDILQWIVIIIAVVAIAVNTMPPLMKSFINEGEKGVGTLTTDIQKAYAPAK